MNLGSMSYTLAQISSLVNNLSKCNYELSVQEIFNAIRIQGFEADRHLLRCLLFHIDFSKGPRKTFHKNYYQAQLLIQQCETLLNKPSLTSILCFALDNPLDPLKAPKPSVQQFAQLSRILHLTPVQEVVFGLVCLESINYSKYALEFVKQKLPLLIKTYINSDIISYQVTEGRLCDSNPEVLHLILSHIFNDDKQLLGISEEIKKFLLLKLRCDFPLEVAPVLLAPIIYSDKPKIPLDKINSDTSIKSNMMESLSLSDLIMKMGYSLCSSFDECRRKILSVADGCIPSIFFGPESIAKVLSIMIRTHTALDSQIPLSHLLDNKVDHDIEKVSSSGKFITWNIEVFVNTIKDLNPSLSWVDLINELDNELFLIKDRHGLVLLFLALRVGLNAHAYRIENFPIYLFYRRWKNSKAQMSLIQHILRNSDVFCFADYPYRSVSISSLKVIPGADNKDLNTWQSIDLVDLLIHLADNGLYYEVQECLKFPVKKCPDILVLALIQSNEPFNMIRHDIISNLIPVFLGNHNNSAIILHHAWNHQVNRLPEQKRVGSPYTRAALLKLKIMNINIRHTLVQAMSDWYMGDDQDHFKLSRILDITRDLKALTLVLSVQQFPFIIDLACLASRRDYLKLEKWLSDKIQEHGERFVIACVKFLQKRCPQLFGSSTKDENLAKYTPLSPETILIMLNCLRNVSGSVSHELSVIIVQMISIYSHMCVMKGLGNNHNITSTPIFHTPQPHRPVEGSALQVMINQHNGLTTRFSNIGLNSTIKTDSTCTLAGYLGPLDQTLALPSRNLISNVSSFGGFSIMTPSSINTPSPNLQSQLSSNPMNRFPPPQIIVPSLIDKHNDQQIDHSLFMDGVSVSTPLSIEDEANLYFKRIYNLAPQNSLTIEELLEILKRFQESPVTREKEIFCCMLRSLFEEYRFFQEYPEKELFTTAHLFGGIVGRNLIPHKDLGHAFRLVLDALKKPPNSKMYNFGITALDCFKNRLKDYNQYCYLISAIPHFHEFPQHLIKFVECGKHLTSPEISRIPDQVGSLNKISEGIFMPSLQNTFKDLSITTTTSTSVPSTTSSKLIAKNCVLPSKPTIANSTNIDISLIATERNNKFVTPHKNLQDKIAFIFNNLNQINLQSKCKEIRDFINNDNLPWLSQYLVMKRVSIEFNFHSLYSNFLDCLNNEELNLLINMETLSNIRILLKSDKCMANFSDRSLLKNLGHWLGLITLAKNKPILLDDINFKMLLVEAYNKGQQELLFTVPFIVKVLESCAKSKVFKPKNPWTMSILNCLAELHQEPDLKLTLKFEVEVLCKVLNIDIQELKPGYVLRNLEIAKKLKPQLSNDSNSKSSTQSVSELSTVSVTCSPQNTPILKTINSPQTQQNAELTVPSINSNSQIIDEHFIVAGDDKTLKSSDSLGFNDIPVNSTNVPPSEPKFNYLAFTSANTAQIMSMIVVHPQIPLFVNQPELKTYIRPIIEQSILESLSPIVDTSVAVSISTTEQIVKKDFGLDSDESHVQIAAHCMLLSLTASYTMMSCHNKLMKILTTNIRKCFLSIVNKPTQTQVKMIDQACTVCANDNYELACAFIQKTAIEKAVIEIDKYLKNEYEKRNLSKKEGHHYYDPRVMSDQAKFLPESLQSKIGLPSPQMIEVYDKFAKNLPGFQPLDQEIVSLFMPKNLDDLTIRYEKIITDIKNLLQLFVCNQRLMPNTRRITGLHNVLESMISLRTSCNIVVATNIINKVAESFLEGLFGQKCLSANQNLDMMIRFRDIHLSIIRAFQDPRAYNLQWTNRTLTKAIVECREEIRLNLDAIDILIQADMLSLDLYDLHLAMSMENGTNYVSMNYVNIFLQNYLIDHRLISPVNENHFQATINALNTIVLSGHAIPDGLKTLLGIVRQLQTENSVNQINCDGSSNSVTINSQFNILPVGEYNDPPELHKKTELLLKNWLNCYSPNKDLSKIFSSYILQMNCHGILKSDDIITRFFCLSTQMVIESCYQLISDQSKFSSNSRASQFQIIDGYVKLIVLLIKHSGNVNAVTTKTNLLNKILGIVVSIMQLDHVVQTTNFQQFPYHRILIGLFLELNVRDSGLESIHHPMLSIFCQTLHLLRPRKFPGFTYAWLELISHRLFIGRLLVLTPQQKSSYDRTPPCNIQGWNLYAQLLIDLFKYLAPFLRNAELAKPILLLYEGTLKVLLILLHDFPEFLCEYYYGFCDVIPPNCIQMRNLILSAFPRAMRLPDPFTPNLKIDILSEISVAPKMCGDIQCLIQPNSFKKDLDLYLKTRSPVTFLSEIRTIMQQSCNDPGMRYNITLMNAVVLYVGNQAIQHIYSKGLVLNMSTITHSAHMDVFQNLCVDLDTEGRYLFLNAISNQLRYPNTHTHYFSCTLLYLFAEANSEAIKEQITRILLERLIVSRPHPWGLLITFIELIKNQAYKFWNREFVHCAPEIEKLFESVARSCMVQKQSNYING